MPSVGVPRLLTWPCSRGTAHWGQRELGLRAALTQSTFPWSATSEWKPGHPHTQVAAITSQACLQSQQLLVNTAHTPVTPSSWAMEQRVLDGLSCRAGHRKPQAQNGAHQPGQVTWSSIPA